MKLTAHVIDGYTLDIRPAPRERDWMDRTEQRYAYRCLPLDMANALGWELLCQTGFSAEWSGGNALDDVRITADPGTSAPAVSHFGYGVLTFHVPCLFRTEPAGTELLVTGPLNRPKDGIGALSGMVETDWSPYPFTMNWKFTRPGRVRFEAGEPFAHLLPLHRPLLQGEVRAEWRPLSETPELDAQYRRWTQSRGHFLQELPDPESAAAREQWQRGYFRGVDVEGCPAKEHRVKLRLPDFSRGDGS
ncbi:DUF6065 family protein [Pseudoxanthomonas koreensis]|uniref:DUF6065 family protein n=1 Tax=Pseudoxanthomonas koreensis TaxID=266061 RepID=UPI00139197AD|nr:DUF6065 family protein [Pseudoxanthomonas koreensis]KAF1690377.1 hypothetical protein CSC64_11515 [Pseudoxanthomonas koreensis]